MRLYSKWLFCTLVATAPIFGQGITITTGSPLPNGVVGTSYSQTLSASGGTTPYTWTIVSTAGSPPPGLSLSTGGTISGTPTQPGTFNFTVQVRDNSGRFTDTQAFALTIQPAPLVIQNSSPAPPGVVGVAYQEDYNATGGNPPYTFVLYSGNLPLGLTLASNGLLSGTPTTPGNYTYTLQATDTAPPQGGAPRTVTKSFTLRITLPITVTSPTPINATVGVVSTTVMTATGGAPPYLWQTTGTGFPTWLKFDPASNDFLTGTPPAAGTFTFTVKATDSLGNTATKTLTMVVTAPGALAITTATPLPNGSVGASYSVTLAASGGVTPYTWSIDTGGFPTGLLINPSTGVISGTPSVTGTTSFIARVTDSAKATITKAFSITITGGSTQGSAAVSSSTLNFSALVGGDTPAPQSFSLISTGPQALQFTVQVDGGTPGSPAPSWIGGRPLKGSTPARFVVTINQAGLTAGKYVARVLLNTSDNKQTIVTVNLTVDPATPALDVSPNYLRFGGTPNPSGLLEQQLLVRNIGGGGPISFTASPVQGSAWLSISPTSGTASPNAPALVRVTVNTQSLSRIPQRGLIHFESAAGSEDIPISLIVRDDSPVIDLNVNGLRFEARDGNGNSNTRNVNVLNRGQGSVNWRADLLAGGDWITLGDTSGSATPGNPSRLSVSVNPGALDTGNYYGLVRVIDPNALASPQYLPIFLGVKDEAEPATPDPSPSGLFFVARAGGPAPAAQVIRVFTSSTAPVSFQVSGNVSDSLGSGWLSITPATGTTSTNAVAQVSVSVNPAGLPPGLYSGDVTFAFSSTLIRTTNITLVIQPASAAAASDKSRSAVGCNPAKLSLTQTGLVNSFAAPAGWPTPLIVRLADDCGDPVLNGQVVATFSNGDPALAMKLTVPEMGLYSATWSPGRVSSTMTITARAAAPSLQATSADITGSVTDNKAPVLFPNRIVNNLFGQDGAPLAPGMVAQIFGSGLASSTVEPGVIPLPKEFNGTRVLVGAFQAPLYFLSDGQLNVQLPTELQSDREYSVIVATPGGITLPDTISLAKAQPGVVAFSDRRVVAQHSDATASLITPASPAKPGEVITMYLVGMGPTNPSVPSSSPSPGAEPLARVVSQPTITIGGKEANIIYAGLTPFAVGLYQATLFVPDGVTGDLPVVISQNGVEANTTVLPVR